MGWFSSWFSAWWSSWFGDTGGLSLPARLTVRSVGTTPRQIRAVGTARRVVRTI